MDVVQYQAYIYIYRLRCSTSVTPGQKTLGPGPDDLGLFCLHQTAGSCCGPKQLLAGQGLTGRAGVAEGGGKGEGRGGGAG